MGQHLSPETPSSGLVDSHKERMLHTGKLLLDAGTKINSNYLFFFLKSRISFICCPCSIVDHMWINWLHPVLIFILSFRSITNLWGFCCCFSELDIQIKSSHYVIVSMYAFVVSLLHKNQWLVVQQMTSEHIREPSRNVMIIITTVPLLSQSLSLGILCNLTPDITAASPCRSSHRLGTTFHISCHPVTHPWFIPRTHVHFGYVREKECEQRLQKHTERSPHACTVYHT